MKQLFRCEYCSEQGTAEEITKHEEECIYNYNKKSCFTCKHRDNKIFNIICKANKEIPDGKYIEGCSEYEWDEQDHTKVSPFLKGLGGGIF